MYHWKLEARARNLDEVKKDLPKLEVSKVIKATKDKVWEMASDPESILKFDSEPKSVKILKRESNTITETTTTIMGGREITMTTKWILHPKQKLEEEILEGPIMGRGLQIFEEVRTQYLKHTVVVSQRSQIIMNLSIDRVSLKQVNTQVHNYL